jgi:anaerobic magnesium-protoporphyrin IX monomethyl ester cyclase
MVKIIFAHNVWYPFESVMSLSASLKKAGHETKVAVGNTKKIIKEIKKYKPDIIALSVITSSRKSMLSLLKNIKKENINSLIVFGGYDASFFPEILEKYPIDILCRGEGDDAFVELANSIKEGEDYTRIKNLWVKKNGKIIKNDIRPFKDVNERPFPDWDIYRKYDSYFNDIEFEQIIAGRGCPYRCSYCFNHAYRRMYSYVDKKYCSLRRVDKVIKECLILKNKYKVKSLVFNDNTFCYNKKWALEFLKQYKEKVNLPFSINATAKEIDEDLCKAIAETKKCYVIRIGLETGNEKLRKNILNKDIPNKEFKRATNLLKKYGIRYQLNIMFDIPGETLKNSFETLDFANQIVDKNKTIGISVFKPFPKLDITEYGIKIKQYNRDLIENDGVIGDTKKSIFQSFRIDEESRLIINLSRLAQVYIHFPFLRGLIKKRLIYYPDNFIYRLIFRLGEYYYSTRIITNASWKYIIKYFLKHMNKGLVYA